MDKTVHHKSNLVDVIPHIESRVFNGCEAVFLAGYCCQMRAAGSYVVEGSTVAKVT